MTHAERQEMRQRELTKQGMDAIAPPELVEKARQALRAVREFENIRPMGTWDPDECGVGEVEE